MLPLQQRKRGVGGASAMEKFANGKSAQSRSKLWFLIVFCCGLWIASSFFRFELFGTPSMSNSQDAAMAIHRIIENQMQSSSDVIRQISTTDNHNNNDFKSVRKIAPPPPPPPPPPPLKPPPSPPPPPSPSPPPPPAPPKKPGPAFLKALETVKNKSDLCGGKYIFVHDLPPRFNVDMLKDCRNLSLWTNMCKFTANAGLGPILDNSEGVFSNTGWFATNQFSVDVIFHNRMKQYGCRTNDPTLASAIYVPFFAGLEISRHLWGFNISMRDAAAKDLMDWLIRRPEWKINNGHDHFLVGGRITWDFRRLSTIESDWGSNLLFLPAMKNMTMLVVESSPWNRNDMAIPYPTYFHPAHDSDVIEWQNRIRAMDRPALFSFAGAPRPDNPKSIRGKIIEQCRNSRLGKLLECDFGESKCHSPSSIMNMFQHSVFCLQPQGDSYTRRSFFDAILAGCIPVIFHPGSAYAQYIWHLPKNYTDYSVFIPEDDIRKRNVSIEERLLQYPLEQVRRMREEVIKLIPSIVYADPRSKLSAFRDAFDIAVESMIEKVNKMRNEILEGKEVEDYKEDGEGSEQSARKWEGLRREGEKTWDEFFSKPKDEQQ